MHSDCLNHAGVNHEVLAEIGDHMSNDLYLAS